MAQIRDLAHSHLAKVGLAGAALGLPYRLATLFGLPGNSESRCDTCHFGVHLETSANNIAMKRSLPANDVLGGLVSAAIAIPLAMGYGMFAFAPLGEDYFADGALAGIASAVVVAIACVALGDKTTTVYAPRITSTFFLGLLIFGLAHSDEPAIRAGGAPLVLAIAFSIVLLAGAFKSLFGVIKLGTLIKFTPQPVMAGFQNAAAALLFLVQLGNVCGFDRTVPFTQVSQHLNSIKPLSLAVAAITFTTMWNAKKLTPKIPPMLVGMGLGCILYYFGELAGLGGYLGPVIASGPRAPIGPTAFPYFAGLAHESNLIALSPTILGGALALAIIASIDALLCAKLVTAPGEPRQDGDRLLMRLGAGNLAAACIGGITSGINIGPSIANRAFGARTPLSVLVNAGALLIAGTLLFPLLGQIPRVALSAVIMVIAVQHFDVWSLRLVRGLGRGARRLPFQRRSRSCGCGGGSGAFHRHQHRPGGIHRRGARGCAVCVSHEPLNHPAQLPLRDNPFADVAHGVGSGLSRALGRRHSRDGTAGSAVLRYW